MCAEADPLEGLAEVTPRRNASWIRLNAGSGERRRSRAAAVSGPLPGAPSPDHRTAPQPPGATTARSPQPVLVQRRPGTQDSEVLWPACRPRTASETTRPEPSTSSSGAAGIAIGLTNSGWTAGVVAGLLAWTGGAPGRTIAGAAAIGGLVNACARACGCQAAAAPTPNMAAKPRPAANGAAR